ncbi:MAG: cysteine hydrolase [Janthinobacterium lividum]
MQVRLLIIDPQVDFCDPQGALSVAGGDQDMERLARLVQRLALKFDGIHVTLDSHHLVDIAHPIFWKDGSGNHPAPFTIISAQEVEAGRWTTSQPEAYPRAAAYVQALANNGRYPLCIWPPHCLIGSPGHAVMPALFAALTEWEAHYNVVDYISKGSNIFTEHYSAIQADVPDPADPSTQINTALIQTLMQADIIAVAGEAGSHCVANTVRDLADNFGDERLVPKIVLLQDAISPVTGFEAFESDFLQQMTTRGMKLSTTVDFLKD